MSRRVLLSLSGLLAAAALMVPESAGAGSEPVPRAASGKSLAGKVILIDPGHNIRNGLHPTQINQPVFYGIPGAPKPCDTTGTATNSGYPEARYTLAVGLHVVKILRDMGATVVMTPVNTRTWGPCITRRAAIGNQL